MKEKTFYTINLDTKRIIILICVLILLASFIFYIGLSLGKKQSIVKEVVGNSEELNEDYKVDPNEKAPIKMENEIKNIAPNKPNDNNSEIIDLTDENKNSLQEEDTTVLDDKSSLDEQDNNTTRDLTPKKRYKSSSKRKYTIQFGAFRSRSKAYTLKDKISRIDRNVNPYIHKTRRFYTVRAGMTSNKNELKRMIEKLEPSLKEKAIIVRVPKSRTYQK